MTGNIFSFSDYLERVQCFERPDADIDSVTRLMAHQLMQVPFENIDVLTGGGVSLQSGDIVDKIVNRRRGGYCFELNALFTMALQALGIPYRLIAARPLVSAEKRPKTHLVLVVEAHDGKYLLDLGFGRFGIRQPINLSRLETDIVQQRDCYRLSADAEGVYRLKAWADGQWVDQFEFDLSRQEWVDFEPANYYTSTHPDSIFVNRLIVILFTPEGRKILNNHVLKTISQGQAVTRSILPEDLPQVLQVEFGLALEMAQSKKLVSRLRSLASSNPAG